MALQEGVIGLRREGMEKSGVHGRNQRPGGTGPENWGLFQSYPYSWVQSRQPKQGLSDQLQMDYPGQIYQGNFQHLEVSSGGLVCLSWAPDSTIVLLNGGLQSDFSGEHASDPLVRHTLLCIPSFPSPEQDYREDASWSDGLEGKEYRPFSLPDTCWCTAHYCTMM